MCLVEMRVVLEWPKSENSWKQKRKWLGQRPECVMGEKTTLSRWKQKCGGSSRNSRSGLAGDGGVNNAGWSVVGEKESEGKCWETWAGGSDTWLVTCGQCVRVLCEGITQRTLANGRPEKEDEGWRRRSQLQSLHTAAPLLHPAPASLHFQMFPRSPGCPAPLLSPCRPGSVCRCLIGPGILSAVFLWL